MAFLICHIIYMCVQVTHHCSFFRATPSISTRLITFLTYELSTSATSTTTVTTTAAADTISPSTHHSIAFHPIFKEFLLHTDHSYCALHLSLHLLDLLQFSSMLLIAHSFVHLSFRILIEHPTTPHHYASCSPWYLISLPHSQLF